MSTTFIEPGGDADFGTGLWSSVVGAPTTATDFVHGTHIKSIKFPINGTNYVLLSNKMSDAGGRISMYIYFVAFPTSAQGDVYGVEQTGDGLTTLKISISSGGVLTLMRSGGTVLGTGSTLSTGIWYRITLAYTITSTTVNEARVYLNGVLDISKSNQSILNGSTDFFIGPSVDATQDFRFSDVYIDNSSSLTDTGDVWVTAKRPNANGTANGFTTQIGAGGSGYGSGHSPQVNERANSDTNGWSLSNTTKTTEEYNIESVSTGDINITGATIVDYMGWIRSSVDSTLNSPVHHIILNNVATSITESTSTKFFTSIAGSTTYPAGTGTDIGMDAQYTTTAHLTRLFEAGVVVAYIPAVASASVATGFMTPNTFFWGT